MKAIFGDGAGSPLCTHSEPILTPRPGEVLVRVAAAGVNRADLAQAAGTYPPPPGASTVLGLEISGFIIDDAARANLTSADPAGAPGSEHGESEHSKSEHSNPKQGESEHRAPESHPENPVCALLDGGGYAEFVAVPRELVMPVPAGVSLTDAAGLPEAACTVWSALGPHIEALTPPETAATTPTPPWAMILGGCGGVGSFAVQLCAAMGMRVITNASSPEREARVRELGATAVYNHHDVTGEDLVSWVRTVTGGQMVALMLDPLGADLDLHLRLMARDSHIAVIAMQTGRFATIDISRLMGRRITVAGSTLRARPLAQKAAIVAQVVEKVWPLVERGAIRPVTGATFSLDDAGAAEAFSALKSRELFGKAILVP